MRGRWHGHTTEPEIHKNSGGFQARQARYYVNVRVHSIRMPSRNHSLVIDVDKYPAETSSQISTTLCYKMHHRPQLPACLRLRRATIHDIKHDRRQCSMCWACYGTIARTEKRPNQWGICHIGRNGYTLRPGVNTPRTNRTCRGLSHPAQSVPGFTGLPVHPVPTS